MSKKMKINNILLGLLTLNLMFSLSGCGRRKAEQYGQKISSHNLTEVSAILSEPDSFNNKSVTIEGNIIRECPTGCWFDVKDKAGIIHVDINPSGFAIPQKVGKTVTVEGKISVQDGQPTLIGKAVEIQ